MFNEKPQDKTNSISDHLNGLMDNLQKKKNNHDRNFKLNLSINSSNLKNENISKEKNENIGLSLEKILHKQNFDKKYSKIMRAVSPKASESNPSQQIKNSNLWNLKLKNNSNIDRDSSLKRLEDFKFKLVYDQDQEKFDEKNLFIKSMKIKRSSSSDFFKSTTSNSENKTFSSSRNSFNPMPLNNNNVNNANNNINNNVNENLSFNSFKSISSTNFKKNNDLENLNNLNNFSTLSKNNNNNISPKSNTINQEKTKRVNFDDFNSIGENPFKINLYDKNSILNNSRKKYSKYGNMKEGYNLSPKNIYSPSNNSSTNFSYTKGKNSSLKFDDVYSMHSSTKKYKHNGNCNLNNNDITCSRQYTMKRIDNLLKNFSEQNKINSMNLLQSPQSKSINNNNNSANNERTFLNVNENKKRLYNLLK